MMTKNIEERRKLRDMFAAAALPGIIQGLDYRLIKDNTFIAESIASIAMSIGQEMVEASWRAHLKDLQGEK